MSRGRLPKLMDQKEFDHFLSDGERIEVIAVAFADGRLQQLPDRYYNYYQRLKQAFTILLNEPVSRKARQQIEETIGIGYTQATTLINDVQELFPRLEISNREFDRLMDIARIERLIDKIENGVESLVKKKDENGAELEEEVSIKIGGDVNSPTLPRLYKLLAELKGTLNHEQAGPPENFNLPIPQFSTDINDLPDTEAEDAEFEIIQKTP